MKKYLIFLLMLLFSTHFLHAQEQESAKYQKMKQKLQYYEGYIILPNSQKVKGLIRMYSAKEHNHYAFVKFVHLDGTKKQYFPSDLQSYGFLATQYVSFDGDFYKLVKKGKKVRLFTKLEVSYMVGYNGQMMGNRDKAYYLVRQGEKKVTRVTRLDFKKKFSVYFSDCESLKNRILDKELKYKDIRRIVGLYNSCRNTL